MREIGKKIIRALLWLPARIYELAVRLRIAAYETEYLKPKQLKPVVISVGNITVGGTGKTSIVQYISRYLDEEGYSVAILTRGYGRRSSGRRMLNTDIDTTGSSEPASHSGSATGPSSAGDPFEPASQNPEASYLEFGDEPRMLARALPRVPVVIDRNRFEAGQWVAENLGSEVLVLDDGYQHLRLHRDLNILLLDATDPFGGFRMLPFGRLREPLYGLKRADAVLVTRADQPFDQAQVRSILRFFCGEKVPVLYVHAAITQLRHLETGELFDANRFAGWNVAVMCGIGNPEAFSENILQIGVNIVGESFFRDHHPFTAGDLERVFVAAREVQADAIFTTEKDAVRLEGMARCEIPLYAARIEILGEDEVRFKSLLLRTVVKSDR